MNKVFLFILMVFFLAGCSASDLSPKNDEFVDNEVLKIDGQISDRQIFEEEVIERIAPVEEIKKSMIDLPIIFVSQAPTGDWGMPYQEACEEASLIGAVKFLKNEKLDLEIMDQEIKSLVEYEKINLPSYTDNSVEEIKILAQDYFQLNTKIVAEVTIEKIETALKENKVVIAPFAGRMLGNKFYSNEGPLYHFLIIRGFDEKYFYTNDVGTKHGENFRYKKEKLIEAIHDLPILENGEIFRPYDEAVLSDDEKEELMKTGIKRFLILNE
ncbi:MAG: C39 family peptidase [Patescibacteria group bacterium]